MISNIKILFSISIFLRFLVCTFGNSLECLTHFNCDIGPEEKTVKCDDNGIDSIPLCLNPSLVSLTLKNTKIQVLYETAFQYYSDLRFINLSNNTIKEIHKKVFECDQCTIKEFYLDNNKIAVLHPDIFLSLESLTTLSLHGNQLESLPGGIFRSMGSLQILDLSHNRLTDLDEQILEGLTNLLVLRLAHNKLVQVPGVIFKLVPHLTEVSLGGNAFGAVRSDDFIFLGALDVLDLSSTDMSSSLNPNTLRYVSAVRVLRINDCQLGKVPSLALRNLKQLEELELNQNLFVEIPASAFDANTRLTTLRIRGCPNLARLNPGALTHNLNLAHVDLSQNPLLAFLPPRELKSLPLLSFLDLHGNDLQYVPEDAVAWRQVADWRLHFNPIACNCSAAPLRQLLLENNASASTGHVVRCHSPSELRGIPVAHTDVESLRCGLDATTQGLVIGLSVLFVVVAIGGASVALLYRHRDSCIRRLLKRRRKWRSHSPQQRSYDSEYPCIKPVPVTEL